MKKRKTLPKEMKELLENGDIAALKEQFLRCDPNAVTGKYGSNIFSLSPLSHEFAFWAKEQGADIHAATPDGCTPLHAAAKRGHKKAVRTLLKAGAQVGFCWTAADNLFLPFQRFFIDIMRGKKFQNRCKTKRRH